ncbi:MAG TPA: cysteine hydrolase family protein [Gemmatimonadales bacterium]|nr:cysteine hydrolase family protein [Gemmatimonadales bacterium]
MTDSDAPPALILVDIQQGLAPEFGERNNPGAERRAAALLAAWRGAGAPVAHVQHLSVQAESRLRPGEPGAELHPAVRPLEGEPLFRKSVANAFTGTGLEAHLRALDVRRVVVAGLTTEHCVSSTARVAADLGFEVTVVEDATACFGYTGFDGRWCGPAEIHRLALVALQAEFAAIRSSAEVLAELEGRGLLGGGARAGG